MVAQTVSVEIEGTALNAALARLAAVLADPSAAMDQIGRYLVASTLRRFERERAPDGSPWLKSARALAEGGRTLTDTGRLRARSRTRSPTADTRSRSGRTSSTPPFTSLAGAQAGAARRSSRPAPISASTTAIGPTSCASSRARSRGRGHDPRRAGNAPRRRHGRAPRHARGRRRCARLRRRAERPRYRGTHGLAKDAGGAGAAGLRRSGGEHDAPGREPAGAARRPHRRLGDGGRAQRPHRRARDAGASPLFLRRPGRRSPAGHHPASGKCCPSAAGGWFRWRTGACSGSTNTKSAASPAPAWWKRNREIRE